MPPPPPKDKPHWLHAAGSGPISAAAFCPWSPTFLPTGRRTLSVFSIAGSHLWHARHFTWSWSWFLTPPPWRGPGHERPPSEARDAPRIVPGFGCSSGLHRRLLFMPVGVQKKACSHKQAQVSKDWHTHLQTAHVSMFLLPSWENRRRRSASVRAVVSLSSVSKGFGLLQSWNLFCLHSCLTISSSKLHLNHSSFSGVHQRFCFKILRYILVAAGSWYAGAACALSRSMPLWSVLCNKKSDPSCWCWKPLFTQRSLNAAAMTLHYGVNQTTCDLRYTCSQAKKKKDT